MLNPSTRLQLQQTISQLNLADLRWLLEFVLKQIRDNSLAKNKVASRSQDEPATALAHLITKIKTTPPNPANIQPATQSLAEGLAASPWPRDPSFEVTRWNEQWDAIEAQMKIDEFAHEQSELVRPT